jgi:hypothetical protein
MPMTDPPAEGSPYFRVKPGDWADIDESIRQELVRLAGMISTVIEPTSQQPVTPLEMALKLGEVSARLFEQLAGDERDLRQVITTLRTAHAVAWDLYDAVQATRTTVEQHMALLRRTIDTFEEDLRSLQRAREAGPSADVPPERE